jgi:hypothetical protein
MGKYLKILGGAALFLVGLAMIEMAVTEPDFEAGSRIFMECCAAVFLLGGVAVIWMGALDIKAAREARLRESGLSELAQLKGEMKDALIPGYFVAPDKTDLERMITGFREHFAAFFASPVPMENAPVQSDTTQVYRNILELRKNRLRKLGLSCEYKSARKNYGGYSISSTQAFDGKYEITEVSEDIAAKTSYLKDGRNIYSKTDKQIARYVLINAKTQGTDRLICPNCGASETRVSLLDGCDSCGTRFIIEDLGLKVSDFAYRADYNVQYEKYKSVRKRINVWLALIIGLVTLVYCGFWAFKVSGQAASEMGAGPIMTFLATLFAALFPAAAFTFIGVFFFDILIFPWIQIGASATHMTKKMLKKIENAARDDSSMQMQIRQFDPLFSVNAFYCGIQNKLSSIHFADNANQINAFTTFDLSNMLDTYRNVVDIDTQYISLRNHYVNQGLQVAEVETDLVLTEFVNGKCKRRNEKLMLTLTKSAACKTQTVCGPSLMKCRGCGNGLTLLNGRLCPQCGTDIYLEQYDWVIRGYKTV